MYAWTHLPIWVRAGSALILLGISTIMLMRNVVWPWGWAGGAVLLFFSFVKPIGPSPWKDRLRSETSELPPVPRLDGSTAKETPEEVLARIRAARGDKPAPAVKPRPAASKPNGFVWLICGVAAIIFILFAFRVI